MDGGGKASTLVIGIGNWYRSDDAAGLVVARNLRGMNLPCVLVREESGEGAALMEAWKSVASVVIVDAASSGSPPGTIHELDPHARSIPSSFFHYSSHAFGVAEAIELARALGELPPMMLVCAIEGRDFSAGVRLSTEVESAIGKVTELILRQSSFERDSAVV